MRQAARKSIGEALADLAAEFPDVDIKESKLRFLEAEGLVSPDRTPSGYRKYSIADMERLRFIIRAQRDHYLPLKVIREHLDALDRGERPAALPGVPSIAGPLETLDADAVAGLLASDRGDTRYSRRELLKTAGIDDELLTQLESFGLVHTRSGSRSYDADALAIATTAGELAAFGVEPRHLRSFRAAADREVGLVEQIVAPIRRSREPGAQGRAAQAVDDIATLSMKLHASLVRAGLRSLR